MSTGNTAKKFAEQAELGQSGLAWELWGWLRHNKKWWLTPIVLILFLVSCFVILSSTAVAPFIYTLF